MDIQEGAQQRHVSGLGKISQLVLRWEEQVCWTIGLRIKEPTAQQQAGRLFRLFLAARYMNQLHDELLTAHKAYLGWSSGVLQQSFRDDPANRR